ncbi:MAG: glycosyltransferase [Taibaiella sp.]|nr:glycosyltransferase [Taibaiella sp.]
MILSLVLPCYNPQQGWERNIITAYEAITKWPAAQVELTIVLDGTDFGVTTAGIDTLRQCIPGLRVIEYAVNMGKGHAIRQGVAQAIGDIIIYTDIDIPYTEGSMRAVYNKLHINECDVAVGVKDEAYYTHLPAVRRFISRCLRLMIGTFLSMPVTDTQCGLKGFRSKVKPLFLATTINRYLFDLEFVRNCFVAKKYRVAAIPVTLNADVHFRKMDYSILLPEILNFIKLLLKRPHE